MNIDTDNYRKLENGERILETDEIYNDDPGYGAVGWVPAVTLGIHGLHWKPIYKPVRRRVKAETVKVRVFVSVSPQGGYVAYGVNDSDNDYIFRETLHNPGAGDIGYWIEAEYPLPKAPEPKK